MATASLPMSSSLLACLSNSAESFLQPSSALHLEALACVKDLLDPLAANVADAQKLRRDENRKKRKRGEVDDQEEILHIRQLYTNGLAVKQVWEQARRILDATCAEVEREIASNQEQTQPINTYPDELNGHMTDDDDEEDDVSDDLEDDVGLEEELLEEEDFDDDAEDAFEDELEDLDAEEEQEEENDDASEPASEENAGVYVPDPNGLNDGFFSIDDFNRQTQFLEQQDARGEDDNPSDEDEVDWDADPMTMPYHKSKAEPQKKKKQDDDSDPEGEDSDDEEGPTFGDADLDADDSDEDMLDGEEDPNELLGDGIPGLDNTNEVRYADFFAPPPKNPSIKTKRMRALPKTQPAPKPRDEKEMADDMERAMADVRRDLLDSDDEEDFEPGSDVDDDARPSTKNMSTHEKQRAAIASEIRRLEAANVAKRDWTLSGEARAVDRPLNSLIEEDMEFERVGKPVPVVTAEVSEEIEQLIKRRILAREFDEVVRRRPDALGGANDARRGRVELDDAKPQSGLGEIYEQEHLRATDPNYVDKRSAATKKQHDEIARLWKEVSAQLDLLSNLHFKPKRVEAEIKTVEDRPTISMEDARPVGLGVNAEESMLAPQEVYRAGEKKDRKADRELVTPKGGASVNREEMTREEKRRRRRREKERAKKASQGQPASTTTNPEAATTAKGKRKQPKEQEKADILSDLRKGGVKVIDKKGELQDIGGKKARKDRGDAGGSAAGGGALKL